MGASAAGKHLRAPREVLLKHDLDKPVIEATLGETSPTVAEQPTVLLPPPEPVADEPAASRIRAKKAIRIVAQEHKKRVDRTSHAVDISSRENMMLKRSTKLWGSRLEEVTMLGRNGKSSISVPESPSAAGPSMSCHLLLCFRWGTDCITLTATFKHIWKGVFGIECYNRRDDCREAG